MWGHFAPQQFPSGLREPLGLHSLPHPDQARSLLASQGCTWCGATLHFSKKIPKLFTGSESSSQFIHSQTHRAPGQLV